MRLKNSFWQQILLSVYVICFGAGLFQWAHIHHDFDNQNFTKALFQGVLIGYVYFGFQTKLHQGTGWLQKVHFLVPIALYLMTYKAVLPFLWFWTLLLLQLLLLLTYDNSKVAWRRIPVLKNVLIAAMWFIQLNLIPALAGSANLAFAPFFIFYLALSIQVDIEDIEEDTGKIQTFAALLGKDAASYVVVFLLTLFAFIIGLPWVWIMLGFLVIKREFTLPKRSYDALLFVLGLYFLLR